MIDRRLIFEIHRLFHEGYKIRKIARTLRLSRDSVRRYLGNPNPPRPVVVRTSKLDPFKDQIQTFLEQDPSVSAAVLLQRLRSQDYTGGRSILGEYLQQAKNFGRGELRNVFDELYRCDIVSKTGGHPYTLMHGLVVRICRGGLQ